MSFTENHMEFWKAKAVAQDNEDLSDATSQDANARYRVELDRKKSSEPGYAHAPRRIPTGNRRMSRFDLIIIIFGFGILLLLLGLKLSGFIR